MPNPKICNQIADPAARRRCLEYQGEFKEPASPARPRPIQRPQAGRPGMGRPGMGGPGRRPRGGGGGFGGRGGY